MLNLNQMFPFLKYKPGAKPGQCKRSAESTSEKSGDDKKKELQNLSMMVMMTMKNMIIHVIMKMKP